MADDKPRPLQDVRKGLGLLFRAARTAVDRLPKGGVEEVVKTSAREVGRAFENVATTIEREVFGKKGVHTQPSHPPDAHVADANVKETSAAEPEPPKPDDPKPPDAA